MIKVVRNQSCLFLIILSLFFIFFQPLSFASEYRLSSGDIIRITVYKNPDLTSEVKVSGSGSISFPLLGKVNLGGLSISEAESLISTKLRSSNYVQNPNVNILPLEIIGSQVSVLGQVNKPGRYPIETANIRVSDIIARAGGISPSGSETIVLKGQRRNRPFKRSINIKNLFNKENEKDEIVYSGDIIYVNRAPVFYIYGEVKSPGVYKLEQSMSVLQGLATGGGLTSRGTDRSIQINRSNRLGELTTVSVKMDDPLVADDVIYVRESLF